MRIAEKAEANCHSEALTEVSRVASNVDKEEKKRSCIYFSLDPKHKQLLVEIV